MGRAYRPGFGWEWLALCGIAAAVALALLAPAGFLDRIVPIPRQTPPMRQEILVVSDRWSDQGAVIQAVRPRGYRVRSVSSVQSGVSSLESEPGRIRFVVVNNDMPGAHRMAGAVKTACPNARVVMLAGRRDAASIANLLVGAGMN
jgi:hypothetical protein